MFELLKKAFIAHQETRKQEREFYIINGFMPSWSDDYKGGDPDKGIKEYSTETRYEQYKNGIITREQAINYAVKRNNKAIDKETAEKVTHLDYIATEPDISFIRVEVNWSRSATWGYNPHAQVDTDKIYVRTFGSASGCGYDKRSAAVAEAFNNNTGVLKVIYTLAENALKEGASYRDFIGYGSGYSIIPYFEGGVGVECFWSILKKAGFECKAEGGKTWDIYRLERTIKEA